MERALALVVAPSAPEVAVNHPHGRDFRGYCGWRSSSLGEITRSAWLAAHDRDHAVRHAGYALSMSTGAAPGADLQGEASTPRARQHADAVLSTLISRNPNGMRIEHLRRVLPDLTAEEIEEAGRLLQARGVVDVQDLPNGRVPGRVIRSFVLRDPAKYPVRETVRIGEIEFPRAFHGDVMGAEDLNAYIDAIAAYHATVEQRVTRVAEHLTRRYWGNMAALLGLFVGVFALITQGTQLISAQANAPAADLFLRNMAAVGPLALVLVGFVVLLWALLRRL